MQWFDRTQPQTLQSAVMLSYLNAGFGVLYFFLGARLSIALVLLAVCAYGIANEKRWGYWSGLAVSGIYAVSQLFLLTLGRTSIFTLLFAGVLFALLVHPMSRDYQKVWFH